MVYLRLAAGAAGSLLPVSLAGHGAGGWAAAGRRCWERTTSASACVSPGILDGYQALLSVTQSARMMLPTPIAFKSAARVAQREAFQSGRTARLTKTLLSLAGARGGEAPAVVAATTSEQRLRRRRRLWLRIALASLQRAGPGVVRAGVQAREGLNGAPAPRAGAQK